MLNPWELNKFDLELYAFARGLCFHRILALRPCSVSDIRSSVSKIVYMHAVHKPLIVSINNAYTHTLEYFWCEIEFRLNNWTKHFIYEKIWKQNNHNNSNNNNIFFLYIFCVHIKLPQHMKLHTLTTHNREWETRIYIFKLTVWFFSLLSVLR